MDAETAERVKALARENLDWAYLVETASCHGVLPLLYANLNTLCPDAPPRATLDQLADSFRKQKTLNAYMTGELLRLLTLFESQNIPAIPYKGPLLASTVYGKLAYRQFTDLDILVRKRDFPSVRELLVSHGYSPMFDLSAAQEAAHLQGNPELPFLGQKNGILVEIQWRIEVRRFSFEVDFDHLSPRLENASLGGKKVRTLAPYDLLLILCVHSASHLCSRLGWICDVAEFIRLHHHMDWEEVIKRARSLRGEQFLFLGIRLANRLLGAPLPEDILEKAISHPKIEAYTSHVCRQLFREDSNWLQTLRDTLCQLSLGGRTSDSIRYVLDRTITPDVADWQFIALPDSLFSLYYVVRPIRLAAKYANLLISLLR